ncbi:MAG: hypothetical protein F9K40_20645 [Kofleriaceae bacterium]|nr:MAG: hypothetical protein F9K40_20645 [Kofleriaceae bacterium]
MIEPSAEGRVVTCTVRYDACRWEQLLAGEWSVVRRRTYAGGISYLVIRRPLAVRCRLTSLERRVVELSRTGEYGKQIAELLGIHESTVSRALARALDKLGLTSRSDLVLLSAALDA